jgi:hypothetical protein
MNNFKKFSFLIIFVSLNQCAGNNFTSKKPSKINMLPSLNLSLNLARNNNAEMFQNRDLEICENSNKHNPQSTKQRSYCLKPNQSHIQDQLKDAEKYTVHTSKNQRSISCVSQHISRKNKLDRAGIYESVNQEGLKKILESINLEPKLTCHTPMSSNKGRNKIKCSGTTDNNKHSGSQYGYKRKIIKLSKGKSPPHSQMDRPDYLNVIVTYQIKEKCSNSNCTKLRVEMSSIIESLSRSNNYLKQRVSKLEEVCQSAISADVKQMAIQNEDLMEMLSDMSKACRSIRSAYLRIEPEIIAAIQEKEKITLQLELEQSRNSMKISLLEETLTKRNKDYDALDAKYKKAVNTIEKHRNSILFFKEEIKIKDIINE